jgi:hypothetical protein
MQFRKQNNINEQRPVSTGLYFCLWKIIKKKKTTHFSVVPNGETLLKKEKKGRKD